MLYYALGYEGTHIAEFVIAHGAQVNVRDAQGRTPLHHVASANWWTDAEDKARFLVVHGADLTAKDNAGKTPLAVAVASGARDVAVYLDSLPGRARPTSTAAGSLLAAAGKGDAQRVKALLAQGAKVNATNDLGETALHEAARAGSRETVNLLLRGRANPNAADTFGWTPLHAAAWEGRTDIAEVLLARGAKVSARTKRSDTPLHLAAWRAQTEMVRLLLNKGADPNAIGHDHDTPLDMVPMLAVGDGAYTDHPASEVLESAGGKNGYELPSPEK
jgi:ankyrin repeat protein